MITVGQAKNDLGHPHGVASLVTPMGMQHLDYCADRRLVIRDQLGCAHPGGFERADLDAKRGHFLGERLGEATHGPFGGMVRRTARESEPTTNGRYLKDAATLLLPHDG